MYPAFRGSGSTLHILLVVREANRKLSEWGFKLCTQIEPRQEKMYFGTSFFLFLFQFSREAEETVSMALPRDCHKGCHKFLKVLRNPRRLSLS